MFQLHKRRFCFVILFFLLKPRSIPKPALKVCRRIHVGLPEYATSQGNTGQIKLPDRRFSATQDLLLHESIALHA